MRFLLFASRFECPALLERNGLVVIAMDDENLGLSIGDIVDRGNFIEIQPEAEAHVSKEGRCNESWHPPFLEFEIHHLDRMGDRADCDDALDPLIPTSLPFIHIFECNTKKPVQVSNNSVHQRMVPCYEPRQKG